MLVANQIALSAEQEQSIDKYEVLRTIVMKQETRQVDNDEAKEIGEALIDFYQILAEEVIDDTNS